MLILLNYNRLGHFELEEYAHWGEGEGVKPNVHNIKYVTYY